MSKYLDKKLLYAIIILIIIGLIMVNSATYHKDLDLFFLKQKFYKQIIFVSIAMFFSWLLLSENYFNKKFNIKFIYNISWLIYGFTILGLFLVFAPIIGHSVNGSARWLNLGFLTFQPSEIAKLSIVITMARFITKQNIDGLSGIIKTLLLSLPFILVILPETDFGAIAIITTTAFTIVFIAGANLRYFNTIILILLILFIFILSLDVNRVDRILNFLTGSSSQSIQALIGINRGELFGVGLGAGLQKLSKLSEVHTDMIFSLIIEELGIVTIIIIIVLYCYIYYKGFKISLVCLKKGKRFESYLAFGISFYLSFQTLYNILMNLSLLPIKGFTLPLISYGGSSILITIIAFVIILRIDFENKKPNN